jgi:IS5 family transposase
MLHDLARPKLSDFDQEVFRVTVPKKHFLRKALEVIPWDEFHDLLAPHYSEDKGRPAIPAVLMLKLEYLRYHCNASDRGVVDRASTDMSYRYFLQIPIHMEIPNPSSLCIFRGRLGTDGFREVFRKVVSVARENGIVKDRLRLKDATHVFANIAVPTALALVAQIRDKLLQTAEPFAPLMVEGERVSLEMLRDDTKSLPVAERLATRVACLQQILAWADELDPSGDAASDRRWKAFLAQRDLAHQILDDQEHPKDGDRVRSITDPDARRSKHGEWFDGYKVDISLDPDSEIITELNVLPANGDEAVDTVDLIRQEEEAHGNDIEAVSIDGVGNNGPMLRELEDPNGLNVDTYVPPAKERATELFTPADFAEDVEQGSLTCPAGQTSQYRQRGNKNHTTVFRFAADDCRACPLMSSCIKQSPQKQFGRTVRKNDYQQEYQRLREKATTEKYAEIRREHPKVERKLGELMNRHGGRHARYRGSGKVLIQQLLAATATNVKRIVRLMCAPKADSC